jgi:hypothetical protein
VLNKKTSKRYKNKQILKKCSNNNGGASYTFHSLFPSLFRHCLRHYSAIVSVTIPQLLTSLFRPCLRHYSAIFTSLFRPCVRHYSAIVYVTIPSLFTSQFRQKDIFPQNFTLLTFSLYKISNFYACLCIAREQGYHLNPNPHGRWTKRATLFWTKIRLGCLQAKHFKNKKWRTNVNNLFSFRGFQ